MKKRKLLIWTTLIVVLAVVLGVAAWHLWEVEKRIEFAIRSKIDVAFSDKLQVGDINLAFGRLHLSDIRYQFEVSPLLLSISDISISYNILSFIKAGFKFEQTSNEIIITAPAITYILRENGVAANKVTREQISELLKNQYQTAIKSIEFINSATVSNGSVFIIDSLSYARTGESKTYAVVQGVNGWIETQKDGKAFTRLAGRFFNSKNYSAKVVGTADLSQGTLDSLIVQLVDYKFERQLLTEFPEYLTNVDGKINGFLKLQENARGPGYDLSGKIRVSDGEMDLEAANLFIDDLDIESRLDNFDFIIDHGEFTLNDSKVKIAGSIQNLLAPQLLVDVYSPEIDLQKFAYRLSPQSPFPINGKGKVHLAIRESIQSPQFSGFFIADTLSIINRPVQDIRIEMSFRDSTLYLDEVRAQFLHSKIESWGELAFNKARRPLNMHLVAEGEFLDNLEDIFPFAIPSNFGAVDAELFGPLDSPVLRGNYSFTVSAKDRNPLDLLGHFTIDDWNLNFGAGTMDRKFQASGAITNLAEHALYQIHIENIGHILTPLGVQPISQIADRYSIDANLNGIREDMNLELSGYNFQSNSTHFTSTFRLTQKNPNLSKIAGTIQILPKTPYALATNFKANLTDTSIVFTQLGNQHWFDGRCKIDLREEKAIDAEFRVSNLELDQVVPKNDDGTTKLSGKLLSQVQIKGDLHKPEIKAETWMLGAKYNGIGVLSAHVKVALEDNNVHIENVSLSRNNIPLVRSAGWVNISPFAVNFDLIAQDLDMNDVILATTRKDSILGGKTDVNLKIRGNTWPAPALGSVKIHSGNLLWFKFDELAFEFDDSTNAEGDSSYVSFSGLQSNKITYTRKDEFVLNGGGYIPFNGNENLDVHLQGYGNIFATFFDFIPLLRKASSSCALDIGLKGEYKNVRLVNSKFTVVDGQLSFAEVAKDIKQIQGDVVTEDDFIHIKSATGIVGDASLSIYNTAVAPSEQGSILTPLRINNNWMSLGTFYVKSNGNGLPLNIPALMPPNEIGRFQLKGMNHFDSFLVSGPWHHPVFRGEIVLNDVNVIYPYYEISERPSPLIDYIMLNSNWDVHAIAGKNNRYVAEFSNIGIDKVIINAGIDDGISELTFTGIIIDTTKTLSPNYGLDLALNREDSISFLNVQPDSSTESGKDAPAVPLLLQQEILRTEAGPDTSTFRIAGQIESTRGTIEYLDLTFRVDKFVANWDKSSLDPVVWGQAWTTVVDSLNEKYVYLKLQARDPVTGEFRERGRYEEAYFKLESEIPAYNTSQMQVLSILGYDPENISDRNRTTNIIGASTENLFLRPLLRPVERTLERSLGLDVVRLNSRFTQNFLNNNQFYSDFTTTFLQNTQLTVGKYISNKMYFLYTGRFSMNNDDPGELNFLLPNTIELKHSLDLEYRFNPSLLLQLGYKYNEATYLLPKSRQDKNILLRYSFPF